MVVDIPIARRHAAPTAAAALGLVIVQLILAAIAFALPVDGTITQGFNARHNGLDISAAIGTPIRSVTAGKVTIAGGNDPNGYGLYVQVLDKQGYLHDYGHVNAFYVEIGQEVVAGQHIADVGNRGQSSGAHVHWRVTTPSGDGMDPLQFVPPSEHEEQESAEPPITPPAVPGDLGQIILALLQAAWQEIQKWLPRP